MDFLIWVLASVAILAPLAIVHALRALWLYGGPVRLRMALLLLVGLGLGVAGIAWWARAPTWAMVTSLLVALGPITWWVTWRWLNYDGPPAGLITGPAALENAQEVLVDALESQVPEEEKQPPV